MNSTSSIVIRASREEIFDKVRQLLRWPEFLPHYRFVRSVGSIVGDGESRRGDWQSLHMSAEGGLLPVSWRALYRADESRMELHFEHIAFFTKGMNVVWTLVPTPEATIVQIKHTLSFRVRSLGWLIEPVLQYGFIEPVAHRTLATFKRLLEGES